MNQSDDTYKPIIKRIGGHLHKLIPVKDPKGNLLNYALKPLQVEFKPRDLLQVIVGATLLAIPIAFTEEAWQLAIELPNLNVALIGILSLVFISLFIYFNFYRYHLKGNKFEFLKRVLATYLVSAIIVALFLTIIQRCPWEQDFALALKRVVIVTLPASMSATLSDTIK